MKLNTTAAADMGISFGFYGPGIYAPAPVYGVAPYYAAPYVYHPAPRYRVRMHRVRKCRPVYSKRRVRAAGRGWTRAKVRVGRSCKTVWR